jgi:hypothetical protein
MKDFMKMEHMIIMINIWEEIFKVTKMNIMIIKNNLLNLKKKEIKR